MTCLACNKIDRIFRVKLPSPSTTTTKTHYLCLDCGTKIVDAFSRAIKAEQNEKKLKALKECINLLDPFNDLSLAEIVCDLNKVISELECDGP